MSFEFDPSKGASNKLKHGIDFEAAQALWRDDRRLTVLSDFVGEQRFVVVGSIEGRLWAAAATLRGEAVRIISVRRARPKEEVPYGTQDDQC